METRDILVAEKLFGIKSYDEYYSLVQDLARANQTSGSIQSSERILATRLNAQRMKRLTKQSIIQEELVRELAKINEHWVWTVLAESWCGDGAQNIPIIAAMAKLFPEQITLRIVLRDENETLMNDHLTNAVKAIPKLICHSESRSKELGTWGPRPAVIQERVRVLKMNSPAVSHDDFVLALHQWYAEDKGVSLQNEFEGYVRTWNLK
jgi:hypothetical protein